MKPSNTRLKKLQDAILNDPSNKRFAYVSLQDGVYHLGGYNGDPITPAEFEELEKAPGVQVILLEYVDMKAGIYD